MSTLLMGLQTTFREKLEWLEEAETLGSVSAPTANQPPEKKARANLEPAKAAQNVEGCSHSVLELVQACLSDFAI